MKRRKLNVLALLAGLSVGGWVQAADAPAAAPAAPAPPAAATAPATTKPAAGAVGASTQAAATTQAIVTPQAKAQLEQMDAAYKQLGTLDLAGKLALRFDVMGQKQTKDAEFTSSYQAPNRFRQDVKDDVVAGSTGEKMYLYSKDHNVYLTQEAPKGKMEPGKMPEPYGQVIGTQNPSLMLALSSSPSRSLTDNLGSAEQLEDVKLEGKAFNQLRLSDPQTGASMAILLDPTTHLLRRATLDMTKALEKRGATDVKQALVTVDYSATVPGAAVKENQFAWTPPADAKDAAKEQAAAEGDEPSKALEGKPAPDFSAKNLDDKDVTLKDQKGKVVILDFWATWCPPCREGLPHVDKVYQDLKEKGVVAFAVDVQEPKDKVKQYVTDNKLTLPALLDTDGKVSGAFKVSGIPQTVVIGKDGVVKNVFVGTGPDSEEKLRKAVEAALAVK
ncbi:MAG TPA: TlpA disulfide reductase family protein [Tepidisphaeraceae bacterium]|jgi:peroxiredoxin